MIRPLGTGRFIDGSTRTAFRDTGGRQFVLDEDGEPAVILALLLLADIARAGAPTPTGTIPGYELASLTEDQSRRLQYKVRVCHVAIITAPWEHDGCTFYGCWSLDWTKRGVWFRPGVGEVVDREDILNQTERVRLTVQGSLLIMRHRLGLTELRVVDCEMVSKRQA